MGCELAAPRPFSMQEVFLFCFVFVFALQSVGLPSVLKSNYYIHNIFKLEDFTKNISLTFFQHLNVW